MPPGPGRGKIRAGRAALCSPMTESDRATRHLAVHSGIRSHGSQASKRDCLEAHMSEPRTKPTEVGAESHIAAIKNEAQRDDARALVALMRRVTGQEPTMWGPSIVGFGSYHYKYESGREGDSALAGFAVRGSELVVYIAADFEGRDDLLARLGKHRAGKVCVYIRRLADVDAAVLETLVARSIAETRRLYPQPDENDA